MAFLTMKWAYLLLATAIVAEVIGTTALKASEGFSRFGPSLVVVIAYGLAFYCLSWVMKAVPIGVAYAIWSGVGIVLIAVIGWLFFRQHLDLPAIVGVSMIVGGVIVIQLFSKTTAH